MDCKLHRIVCFSGGHSSALAAIETVRKYGPDGVILLNHNISPQVEHEDIKRFKQEVADYLGIAITYANRPDWETATPISLSIKARGFGAPTKFCTSRLKTEPFHKWLRENGAPGDQIIYGFDAEEENRIHRRRDAINAMGYIPEFPLAEWERTIFDTEEIGIRRPITYQIYRHANCIGCLKAGKQHWYCVFCLRPDIFDEAVAAEDQIGHSIIKGVYLKDLEAEFHHMRDVLHICPTEKMNASAFWAKVRKAIPEEEPVMPCDCSF